MVTQFRKLSMVLLALIGLSVMISCIGVSTPKLPDQANTNMTVTEIYSPTNTLAVTLAETQSMYQTPKTKISMPTEMATHTPLPTLTAMPTYKPEDASVEIMHLLSLPKNQCFFPCWWNFVPGKTRIVDMQNNLYRFSSLAELGKVFRKDGGFIGLKLPQSNELYLDIYLEFEGNYTLQWLQVIVQMSRKNYVDGQFWYDISWGDPNLVQITKPYNISMVLSSYGEPAEVFLFTHQAVLINQPWPISLIMFYPEYGFMIEYVAEFVPASDQRNGMWCPTQAFPYFWFWSPEESTTVDEVLSWIPGYQFDSRLIKSGKAKTLEEATGMSIEELIFLYDVDENACIKTPREIWPLPGE